MVVPKSFLFETQFWDSRGEEMTEPAMLGDQTKDNMHALLKRDGNKAGFKWEVDPTEWLDELRKWNMKLADCGTQT